MITFASIAVLLIMGSIAVMVVVLEVTVTVVGTRFARGLNW